MKRKLASTLFLLLLSVLGPVLLQSPVSLSAPPASTSWADPASAQGRHAVFLAGQLSREQLVALSASLAASRHPGVLLLDSEKTTPFHKQFLANYHPDAVVPIGTFEDSPEKLQSRLGVKTEAVLRWESGAPLELWQKLFPKAERVVVCPAKPYRVLLQAACLASAAQAPLYIVHGKPSEGRQLRRLLDAWQTKSVFVVGAAAEVCPKINGLEVVALASESAVAAEHLRRLSVRGPIHSLVVTNPADAIRGTGSMSALAPWIAFQRRAPLLLTNRDGKNVSDLVLHAVKKLSLQRVDNLILVADLQSIPMEERANPIPDGKDPTIEMEPLTPKGKEPFSFATGRLFNEDPSVVTMVLARERLLARERRSPSRNRKALMVSNAAGGLPLLEVFSRNTVEEMRNCGYETKALFGAEVSKEHLKKLLPDQDIFLWEGHCNTLIKDYQVQEWKEPLQPSLIFLQSCLALQDYKAQPILERGAMAVVGSSTRMYSGSGGAFALCYFDALNYEDQSLGSSLRHAKNFLLAYSLLKEKRLGKDAKLTMVNLRSAWAFSLWGDPTLKLPAPRPTSDALPPVQHWVDGNTIRFMLPDQAHARAITERYKAQMLPNGRLAGLITRGEDDDHGKLVPFVFAEVALPQAPHGKKPHLSSKLPSRRWVFCWDARRRSGYLLVMPRSKDTDEIRFQIHWEPSSLAVEESAHH